MNPALARAAAESADPDRARRVLDRLTVADTIDAGDARVLAALCAGSDAMGNLLVSRPEWLPGLAAERLQFPRRDQGLRKEVSGWLDRCLETRDYAGALYQLREFKQREMLRIAARDLAGLGALPEVIREISDVADACLSAVWRVCFAQAQQRYGRPWHEIPGGQWLPTEACVLGMGKLGGQELNYSSDVDVLFVYAEEGQVFKEAPARGRLPRAVQPSHAFFNRLAEAFIAEVSRLTPEGTLFRIDLRLRPEGDSGPLSRSLGSYENYYAQYGQTWERMMLIKARPVAGSGSLGAEFLETLQPFRYPRTLGANVPREIRAMKDRIETEVVRADELDRNVKLGRGGIREIEFIVQSLQLLHAGRQPFLQGSQTLPGLQKLAQYRLLGDDDARVLAEAYDFLRRVEHRLQMEGNLQTHTLPAEPRALERLARLMGFAGGAAFESARRRHCGEVRSRFESLSKSESGAAPGGSLPPEFAGQESAWQKLLAAHAFRDPAKAFQMLREFVEGPGYVHVSTRTVDLARALLERFLALCRGSGGPETRLSDPDRVVTRLDSFIAAYGARAVLFELWNSNPAIFELLVRLFDRSEFLAELAIRTPDMVDELVTSGRLRQRKTAAETLRDLRHGLKDKDQKLWLRRYHQVEVMRIGLRDILGLADDEHYLAELSALADACLQYALEAVLRRHRLKQPPFTIIGLGKLGGAEIDYGSDLDIIFVAGDGAKEVRKLQPLALEVLDLLSDRTELGLLFHTDARLRPDGEKGLLVNTLGAYEDYYRQRAHLWEIQSLTRVRPVAGDPAVGKSFQQLAAALTDFRPESVAADFATAPSPARRRAVKPPKTGLAAYRPGWKQEIHRMRLRIEKERTPAGKDALAIKTGAGGLVDAEFLAQAVCLEQGWQEANTLRALERAAAAGRISDPAALIENYRRLRRVEGILRRWSYEGEILLPDDPAPYYRVSVRCGFETPQAFRDALAEWRRAIRSVYLSYFQ